MNIKNQIALTLIVPVVLGLGACTSDDDKEFTPEISWTACDNLECGELTVPMDYQSPDGEEITIALIRHKSSHPDRLGSLLFNPGGPADTGVRLVEEFIARDGLPQSLLDHYDIVGFDPRGVGDSTPVDCSEYGLDDVNEYPLTNEDITEMHADISQIASLCSEKHSDYLQQLGSLNVVRDMEEIRQALGDSELNFIGYSYGTRLAALYLQEYPANSGRIVLDASLHPVSTVAKLTEDATPVLQANLIKVLSECVDIDPQCDATTLNNQLIDKVASLVTDPSGEDELDLLAIIVIESVLDPNFGEIAATPLINYLNSDDPSGLQMFIQSLLLLEEEDESEDEDTGDSEASATEVAILCADDATRYTAAELHSKLEEYNLVSDVFAELQVAQVALCSGWPEALEPLEPIATSTAPVSLVIGGTSDAQTPLQWSEDMAQQIGGLYIRSEHAGHTSVFNGESECVDNIVVNFLVNGVTPAVTSCVE